MSGNFNIGDKVKLVDREGVLSYRFRSMINKTGFIKRFDPPRLYWIVFDNLTEEEINFLKKHTSTGQHFDSITFAVVERLLEKIDDSNNSYIRNDEGFLTNPANWDGLKLL
jgi:hypothetical protein